MSWLAAHNFPFGIVSFCETVSKDFQKHKLEFLKNVCKFVSVILLEYTRVERFSGLKLITSSYKVFLLLSATFNHPLNICAQIPRESNEPLRI